jgi:hypothetical protein
VRVLRVEQEGQRLQLNTGEAQAIRKGARFAIYPVGTDPHRQENRIAIAQVIGHGATESWAEILEQTAEKQIHPGDQAFVIDLGPRRLRRAVCFDVDGSAAEQPTAMATLERVKDELSSRSSAFVELVEPGVPTGPGGNEPELRVIIDSDSCFSILDRTGEPLPYLRPPLVATEPDAVRVLVDRLEHLSRYRNIADLDNRSDTSPLRGCLQLEMLGLPDGYQPCDEPRPFPIGLQEPIATGKWLCLRIQNRAERPLNVVVLNLRPGWSIKQIHPDPGSGDYLTLDPEEKMLIPLRTELPAGYNESRDIAKVIGTLDTSCSRWLELPRLDEPYAPPVTHRTSNPLEKLFAALAADRPKTRFATPSVSAADQWVTATIEITIQPRSYCPEISSPEHG